MSEEWSDEQAANRNEKSERDGENVPARHFEDGDALLPIDCVLKDGLRLARRKMVEGSEDRAKTVELRGDFRRVHRGGMEKDLVARSDLGAGEC